jgi:peptidyl-prolyl cis-trans isomerase B (cyclophilin B)
MWVMLSEEPYDIPVPPSPGVTNPQVTIEVEDFGRIVVELFPDKAPNTVNNFLSLAGSGFYDGAAFTRISPGFFIQGGISISDPRHLPYTIAGEFSSNGFTANDVSHVRGILSMARAAEYDSANNQFAICLTDFPNLDGNHAAFGQVIEGMNVVNAIVAATPRDENDRPIIPPIITGMTVELFGQTFPEPTIIQ